MARIPSFTAKFIKSCALLMDPLYERRLRNEVIYLHSLWHRGPPRAEAVASTASAWTVVESSIFKNGKRLNRRAGEFNSSPGVEWTCPPANPPSSSFNEWPKKAKRNPIPPVSAEEQSKWECKHAHERALKAAREFFLSKRGDDEDEISFSSDEDDELMEEDDGREEYSFFLKVFGDIDELKQYYEKNFRQGEFNCLVCSAVGGKNAWKKYKGCLALVQHSISVAKAKKRRAHKAFGQAICKILGWDIDMLPSVVSMLSANGGTEMDLKSLHGNINSENKELLSEIPGASEKNLENPPANVDSQPGGGSI